jgi:hypothetical protein
MSIKLSVPVASLRLNLVEAHREHCPWKNGAVQNNTEGPIADMPAWQTLQFMVLAKRRAERDGGHERGVESVDLGSEASYPRASVDGVGVVVGVDEGGRADGSDGLNAKWKKFKAKLRRTTSKKSLKSVKSVKSAKSGKSGKDD